MTRKPPPDWLLVLLLIAGVYLWQRTVFPAWMIDLFHIQYAAYQWQHGEIEWMYTTMAGWDAWMEHWRPVAESLEAEGDPNAYFYPPFLAALLSPVADVNARVWRDMLFGINVLLLFVFAYQIVRLCRARLTWRSFLWALSLVLITYPMARATKLAQIVPLLAAVTWIGLLAMRQGKYVITGALIGITGAIKIFPLGFLAYPLFARKWKAAAAILLTVVGIYAVSLLTLGLRVHEYWWTALREFSSVVYVYFGNQAISAWFARAVLGYGILDTHFQPPPIIAVVRFICLLVFCGVTVWTLWVKRKFADEDCAPQLGLLSSGIVLSLSVAWEHYWLFVLPPLGWAIYETWTRGDKRFWELWLAVATFFFTMKLTRFYGDAPIQGIITGSQSLGMILLWAWFLRRVWNSPGHVKLNAVALP